jgi:type I restriction enzyme S subunit
MDKAQQIDLVHHYLRERYAGDFHRLVTVREFLERVCARHIELGLGDSDLAQKLCSGDEYRYWQHMSEILLGHELLEAPLALTPSHEGPDFLVEREGAKLWIEVICPRPEGIPADWLERPSGKAISMPHEAMLLRWTAAIKEKAEKLLGSAATGAPGYIAKHVVGESDAYVIAVNAKLLRGPHFASVTGISQYPFAAEAVFAIGPYAVNISRETLEIVDSGHQHRPTIRKPSGAEVPAYTFLDPRFRPISAIWATDIDESWVIGNTKAMAVIHNPQATNPLPVGVLPASEEFVATLNGDEYVLERRPGRLAR